MNVEAFLPEARMIVRERTMARLGRQEVELGRLVVSPDGAMLSGLEQAMGATRTELDALDQTKNPGIVYMSQVGIKRVSGPFNGAEIDLYSRETTESKNNQQQIRTVYEATIDGAPQSPEGAARMWFSIGLPIATVHLTAKLLGQRS